MSFFLEGRPAESLGWEGRASQVFLCLLGRLDLGVLESCVLESPCSSLARVLKSFCKCESRKEVSKSRSLEVSKSRSLEVSKSRSLEVSSLLECVLECVLARVCACSSVCLLECVLESPSALLEVRVLQVLQVLLGREVRVSKGDS